ncbi:MAG TPA: PAS domain S-box protein [Candidatus Baltobacteraceae bacterium]|nr:PAS domain S-box protein [Candidatus Baltobacteraceae bacterium]
MSASKVAPVSADPPMAPNTVFDSESAHVVHFYHEDSSLLDELSLYVGGALVNGDAAVILATPDHLELLAGRLRETGLDLAKVIAQGRYQAFGASEILPELMTNGLPDAQRFKQVIGDIIERANSAAKGKLKRTVVFGELVALLWAEGKYEPAMQIEELWNDLGKTHSFLLRCAYPTAGFYKNEHTEPFLKICAAHSSLSEETHASRGGDEERRRSILALQQRLQVLEHEKSSYENEQQFRLLVDAVQDYAIFMLDVEGRVRTWNRGARRLKGYEASEILGEHFSRFYSEEDKQAGKPQRELEIAVRDGRVEDEGWRIRKDGSKFWANVIITALRDGAGNLIGFGKVTRDFTDRMLAQRRLEQSRQQLQDSERSLRRLSQHLLRSQEEQRRRIGRDLHDSLGQYLSVLKMKLDSLASRMGQSAPEAGDLKQCADLTEDAVKEVRTISYLLYPPMLEEMGLRSAILWYLDGFMKRSGIQTTFEVAPDLQRLPADTEIALFRVLQESLTNVHRHSGSPTAQVRLWISDDTAFLQVTDVGKGMKLQNAAEPAHDETVTIGVGLRGMSERMSELGGKLELSSNEHGTTVTAAARVRQQDDASTKPA